jgi:hypothetical protein
MYIYVTRERAAAFSYLIHNSKKRTFPIPQPSSSSTTASSDRTSSSFVRGRGVTVLLATRLINTPSEPFLDLRGHHRVEDSDILSWWLVWDNQILSQPWEVWNHPGANLRTGNVSDPYDSTLESQFKPIIS